MTESFCSCRWGETRKSHEARTMGSYCPNCFLQLGPDGADALPTEESRPHDSNKREYTEKEILDHAVQGLNTEHRGRRKTHTTLARGGDSNEKRETNDKSNTGKNDRADRG